MKTEEKNKQNKICIWACPAALLRTAAGRALRHFANAPAASFVTHCVRSSVQWPFAASATAPSARWLHALTRFTKKRSLKLWHKREYERILRKKAYKKAKVMKLYAQKQNLGQFNKEFQTDLHIKQR